MNEEMTLEKAYFASIGKIKHNSFRIGKSFPHVTTEENGQYNSERPSFWTSGFWPGLLWLSYLETGDETLEKLAVDIEAFQDGTMAEFDSLHHDVGFQWIPMALADYRITGREESRRRAIRAAILLSSRFNPSGGYLRAWNDGKEGLRDSSGWAIIDCLMNIPLLFWAAKETRDPRFYNIAVTHADTMLKYAVRENGSCAHITMFDSKSGAFLGHMGGQGKDSSSSWSRGQGWLIYGMALAYRETGYERYLNCARKAAGLFMSRLPGNLIPYWDFESDEKDYWVKDSSAAAIAASGMLEIAKLSEDATIRADARKLLIALTDEVADFGYNKEGILGMGTVNYARNKYVNVSIIYGDYFYVEALRKYLGKGNGLF